MKINRHVYFCTTLNGSYNFKTMKFVTVVPSILIIYKATEKFCPKICFLAVLNARKLSISIILKPYVRIISFTIPSQAYHKCAFDAYVC